MPPTFGEIENPLYKINSSGYGDLTGQGGQAGGLVGFISNLIKFVAVAAGLFVLINLIIAGFTYVTAGGDSKKTAEAWARIYMSLIGLVIIVSSYTLAAIVGMVFFGDANAILSPKIYGPGN